MLQKILSNKNFMKGTCLLALAFFALPAFAAMPWETGLERFAQSLCGPTARAIGVLAFAVAGIAIALGEVKGWIHNIMIVMIGIAIAILAPSVLGMLGTSVSFSCA
jgi:type IV secretory pathway VirB2 component (pilin)